MTITDSSLLIQTLVVLFGQFGFMWFRTKNVIANSEYNRKDLAITGFCVHTFWLLCSAIGVNAIIKGHYLLILFSALGGMWGADWALRRKIKQRDGKL